MDERILPLLRELRAILTTTTTMIDKILSSDSKESTQLAQSQEHKPKSSTTTGNQADLRLGPLALNLPREFTLEAILTVARQLGISEGFTRRWYTNQVALGWKDSYGQPVRQPDRYLRYSWKLANRESCDKPKPRRVVAIPSEKTEEIRAAGKQHFAEFRRQMSR
jgi:hypothetical protein